MLARNSGFVARSFARFFLVMMVYLVTVFVSVCWKCRVITVYTSYPVVVWYLFFVVRCNTTRMLSGRSHIFVVM